MELNDQGMYVPVPVREQVDVRTGGVYHLKQVLLVLCVLCVLYVLCVLCVLYVLYVLCVLYILFVLCTVCTVCTVFTRHLHIQGQSRRIHVHIVPMDGNSPLLCDHITSVQIGSIYLRNRYEEPLDSYQDVDVDRLRTKWTKALMFRREYLDSEVRKILNKKGKTL